MGRPDPVRFLGLSTFFAGVGVERPRGVVVRCVGLFFSFDFRPGLPGVEGGGERTAVFRGEIFVFGEEGERVDDTVIDSSLSNRLGEEVVEEGTKNFEFKFGESEEAREEGPSFVDSASESESEKGSSLKTNKKKWTREEIIKLENHTHKTIIIMENKRNK